MKVMALTDIKLVYFDYGGVLAEEGFTRGVMAIGAAAGREPENFFFEVTEIIYECGYVLGRAQVHDFWELVRRRTGITGRDEELTQEILRRFILRPVMLKAVSELKKEGIRSAILSDQSDWLDVLEARDSFFHHFELILNSYHEGISKRDPRCFTRAIAAAHLPPERILFVDDNRGHIVRAQNAGMRAYHFQEVEDFLEFIRPITGGTSAIERL